MMLDTYSRETLARRTYTIARTRKERILLVEDNPEMASLVEAWLKKEQYEVTAVKSGEDALQELSLNQYDLIIMDWLLPGTNGVDACKTYREKGGKCPALMLTTQAHADDVEQGLDAGCDDYLKKPFDLRELSARIRALLRRPIEFNGYQLRAGDLVLETNTHRVYRGGKEVHLLPREFALLRFFMINRGKVFSPESLLDNVWASDSSASPDSIRTYVKRVRRKIDVEGSPSMIHNVHGVGYKFACD